ncbi:hypothetical protein JAAARDRAFT_193723 [Jaapia argillacea MUCL 33604]|uniref:Uncharacterized protein n=1 Tax=Jaapia argillacea MUCL 33604 TaxID=933084 RepID=A0A067PRE1_9AGAM|nr:hypothetical protein JAAARDRAFT_193723 [Jaapia argillacea MUCL 33604]
MLQGECPKPPNPPVEDNNNNGQPSPGPRVLSLVELACTPECGHPKNINDLAYLPTQVS